MIVVGMWLAIVGYGVAYTGVVKLGGGSCTFLQAFKGQCSPSGGVHTTSVAPQSGSTLLARQQAAQAQQASVIGATPISQVA